MTPWHLSSVFEFFSTYTPSKRMREKGFTESLGRALTLAQTQTAHKAFLSILATVSRPTPRQTCRARPHNQGCSRPLARCTTASFQTPRCSMLLCARAAVTFYAYTRAQRHRNSSRARQQIQLQVAGCALKRSLIAPVHQD